MNKMYVKPREAASLICVGLSKFYQLDKSKGFPSRIYVGKRNFVYKRDDLFSWMNNCGLNQGGSK